MWEWDRVRGRGLGLLHSDRPSQCLRALLVRGAEVADYYKASPI